jgi:hypothetical protein
MENAGKPQFLNINAVGRAFDGCVDYNVKFADRTNKYKVDFLARSEIFRDSITVFPAGSNLIMATEKWEVTDNSELTIFNNGKIYCSELYLDGLDHYIEAKGTLSRSEHDTFSLDFGNFGFNNIRPFLTESALDSMEGKMNGVILISSALESPHFTGEIQGRDLKYYGELFGDANLSLIDRHDAGRISTDCEFVRGMLAGVSVRGSYGYRNFGADDQLALRVEIPQKTSVKAVEPFLKGILTVQSGTMDGEFFIKGSTAEPRIEGEANMRNAKVNIDYLKTNYILNGKIKSAKNIFFTKEPVAIHDDAGTGTAQGKLSITHKNYRKFYLDLRIDSARNIKTLNTTAKDNDLYFGTAWADGSCRIFGPFDAISMDIKLANRKNSKISLLYSDVDQNEIKGFIKFVKPGTFVAKPKQEKSGVIKRVDINLDINPELDAEFIIDKQLGDVIKGRGNGTLRMVYDEEQKFYLYGNYDVNEGEYAFSIPGINLITRKIDLAKGGTIVWTGDPYDADLNMTGKFVKKISPAGLMNAVTGVQNKYAPIKIEASLFIRGKLFSPDIAFDIHAPELEGGGAGSLGDVARVLQRIRSDRDETMRQAMALLLFGNFITPSFAQSNDGSSGITGSGFAGQSLSVIANNVVNDIFTQLGIPTRIQVNIDDVKDLNGKANTRVFINSEWFLTERIRLDLNYDPTVAFLVNKQQMPVNFNVEYITSNENWRIKAFSRSSNLLLQINSSTSTQQVSGNTVGIGVVYRREFDTLKKVKDSAAIAPEPLDFNFLPKDSINR